MKHIYELHTAAWLSRLSARHQQPVTLGTVPAAELDEWQSNGMDTIWLMGVWERSPFAARINASDAHLMQQITELLPDFDATDVIGSAYAIKSYTVDPRFGGDKELAQFRQLLADRGMKLLLDFVPNHTAFDHDWVRAHPEYYIHVRPDDTTVSYDEYQTCDDVMIAMGKDPTLEAWRDVAQVNAFSEEYRRASIETLRHIATMCDGVRCDMAMLMLNRVVESAWGRLAGPTPRQEYWHEVITGVREVAPHFICIAETYWETERRLVELGFDYCYDKTTYDKLVEGDVLGASAHLDTLSDISRHLVHFLENHDEVRAASVFTPEQIVTYVDYLTNLPGICLWYDGQFQGYKHYIPVHVRRGPAEPADAEFVAAYKTALHPSN